MASLRMRTVLIILGLLFPLPQSFVIRKRSIGYDFLKDSNALSSEEEEEEEEWAPERSSDELLLDPYSRGMYMKENPERMAMDLMIPRQDDDYDLNDFEDEEPSFDGGYSPTNIILDDENDEKGLDGSAKLLDKSELESLFENDLNKEKKKSTDLKVDRSGDSLSPSKSELTKADVEKLLNPSSKTGMHQMVTETKILMSTSNGSSDVPSYEGVRVVEMTEKEPNGQTRTQKQTQWLMSPDLKQQILDNVSVDDPDSSMERTVGGDWPDSTLDESDGVNPGEQRVTHKVKRSELSTVEDEEELENEEGTSAADQDDVELLKTYIRLQTEENRHLEQALNLAISTQVENSDEYLGDEINQLRMAVENEEALETIRNAIRRRQQSAGEEGEEVEDEEEAAADDENLGVGGGGGGGGGGRVDQLGGDLGESEEDDEFTQRLLKAKLKKFLIDSAVDDLKKNTYGGELEAGGGEEEEEEEEEGDDDLDEEPRSPHRYLYPNVKVLNPFTRKTFGEDRKLKRNADFYEAAPSSDEESDLRGGNDVDISDLLDAPLSIEAGYCPAVRELADDCLAARSEGLILDAEAVSLCNRHQICYFCGSVFGMTSDTCDRGFLGESELLCSGKEQCTKQAAGLYLVMAKAHRFILPSVGPNSYGVCASDCVYDYIVGEADDDRR